MLSLLREHFHDSLFLLICLFCVRLGDVEASWRRVLCESQANDKSGMCIVSVY